MNPGDLVRFVKGSTNFLSRDYDGRVFRVRPVSDRLMTTLSHGDIGIVSFPGMNYSNDVRVKLSDLPIQLVYANGTFVAFKPEDWKLVT